MYAVCRSILCLSLQPGTSKMEGTLGVFLDESVPGMHDSNTNGWLGSGARPSTCRCVSIDAEVDAGSGLLFRPVSFQLHLKRALKLEVMAHLLEA